MNEEPKSFWKKSWPASRWFRVWLILLAATFLIDFPIVVLTNKIQGWPDWFGVVLFILLFSMAIATIFLGLWAFIRWLCCWRNFRRFLFGCACLATLIALFYAEEDWRGWHAWNKFKHQWEAKGERFDMASVIPAAVPDDQNFALTPIVASSYGAVLDKNGHRIQPPNTNVVGRLKMAVSYNGDQPTNGTGNWQKSTVSDLKVWQQYYRNPPDSAQTNEFPVALQPQSPADDVLLALSKFDSAIEELRQASRLPDSRFPLDYDTQPPASILLPHLSQLRGCAQVLQLRAIAELQNGQSDQALAYVKLMLYLANSIRTEPFLISPLVRIAIVNLALQPVYEGLAGHKWSETQLTELEQELGKSDLLSDYETGMRGEMVLCQIGNIEYLRRFPEQTPNLAGENNSRPPFIERIVWRLIPNGWFYQNELRCARMMLEQCLPAADMERMVVSPTAVRRAGAVVEADLTHPGPYNILERMLFPALGAATKKFAWGQESVNLARVACALERYRLAHGEYPKSLDPLAPQFIAKLPHDIINGQPLNYRREVNGQFILYSIGWNEKDDDGEVGLNKDGGIDRDTGDWVWQYPAR
jgi:tetratricopeptide (TPR) repeat protein